MYEIAEWCFSTRAEACMCSNHGFERSNKPGERATLHLETVDQDRAPPAESASGKLHAIRHGAAIVGVWRQDLLDSCILIRAVVSPDPRELHLDRSLRQLSDGYVADLAAQWVATLPGIDVGIVATLHLCQCHGYSVVLSERSDTRLVEPP
jgi:hypothetical protein